jgi:hypothetical protein
LKFTPDSWFFGALLLLSLVRAALIDGDIWNFFVFGGKYVHTFQLSVRWERNKSK